MALIEQEGMSSQPNPSSPPAIQSPHGALPRSVDLADASDETDADQMMRNAWPPTAHYLFSWLSTGEGKQIADKAAGLLESLQKTALERRHQQALVDSIGRYVLVGGIVVAAVWLQLADKLTPVMVGLLSGALGYLLAKQHNN